MDTIFALASAAGKAGVSIIRVSGAEALSTSECFRFEIAAHDRRLVQLFGDDGTVIDQAFALSFAEGRSFTGEQVVELHTHGSPAIVSAVLSKLAAFGFRMAEPGEFTRRAMTNGMMDLSQVEGLADLIDAETEAQRRQAMRLFQGALGERVSSWRTKLIRAAALIEATIDFVDEDVPVDVYPEVRVLLDQVNKELVTEAQGVTVRERLRDGFEIAIVGPPNSGKSTLLNRLAGREAAITSDIAGTTRDVIEVQMDLRGFPVTFLDTAGIREAVDKIEEIGIERGVKRAASADFRVHLVTDQHLLIPTESEGTDIVFLAKGDLLDEDDNRSVSGLTGHGVEDLLNEIFSILQTKTQTPGVAMRDRHRQALEQSSESLSVVLGDLDRPDALADILAEELRRAIGALDQLIGRVDVENVLDDIFSNFCIGK